MYNTFIFVYLFFHLAYPTLREESFGVFIQVMYNFSQVEAINTIILLNFCCYCFYAFTFALLSQFLTVFSQGKDHHGIS